MSPIPEASGIYRIACISTGKVYVGSAVNLRARWKGHRKALRKNEHHSPTLQRAWNKYGEENFVFEILELVLFPEMLTAREQHWLDALHPFGHEGFNIARVAGSTLGVKPTPEARAKMSAAQTGRKHSPETRARISEAKRGKKRKPPTDKARANISRSRMGKAYALGYKHTPEARNKMSATRKGRKHRPEAIEKMRAAAMGRTVTPEARAKISSSLARTLIITDPDGTEYLVHGVKRFCADHGLTMYRVMQVANGHRAEYKGWTARFPEMNEC